MITNKKNKSGRKLWKIKNIFVVCESRKKINPIPSLTLT